MGLERLIRNLYGTTPQIDLDQKILRARIPKPMKLDFTELAEGLKRANVGVESIEIEIPFEVTDARVVVQGTGQTFSLASKGRRLRILGWESPETTRVEVVW